MAALRAHGRHVLAGLVALVLFPLAVHVLQEGAGLVAMPLREMLRPRSPIATLGLGWLGSTLTLSGSPAAMASLALFDRGALGEVQCYTAIVGTRLGAVFLALALGTFYAFRRDARSSVSVALVAFATTQLVAWLSLAFGLVLLPRHLFPASVEWLHALHGATRPVVSRLADCLPGWALFLAGFGGVFLSFKLVDAAIPRSHGETPRWFERRLGGRAFMFGLGVVATALAPSISVSVGLLVPLHAKGYITGARIAPYVLGANVAALGHTLVPALMLGNARVTNVVVTEIVAVALAALLVLAVGAGTIERVAESCVGRPRILVCCLVAAVVAPLGLALV
jgi:hypothetical protein